MPCFSSPDRRVSYIRPASAMGGKLTLAASRLPSAAGPTWDAIFFHQFERGLRVTAVTLCNRHRGKPCFIVELLKCGLIEPVSKGWSTRHQH